MEKYATVEEKKSKKRRRKREREQYGMKDMMKVRKNEKGRIETMEKE